MKRKWTSTAVILGLALMANYGTLAQDSVQSEDKAGESDAMTIEFSKTIKMEKRLGGCEAKLQMEYWQKGDMAEVTSILSNPECAASSGDYKVFVRYRNADGDMQTNEYQETWARDDAEPIVTTRQYRIGDDVDLIRVRSRGLSCSCSAN